MLLDGNLKSVQHLGIFVPDIEQAKAWYVQKLGCRVTYEPAIPTDDGDIKLAFLELGGLVIELVQLAPPALAEVRARTHGHIDHFAVDATDANQAMREVLARGGALHPDATPDGPQSFPLFSKGVQYVFFKGPFNEKVEAAAPLHLDAGRHAETLSGWNHLGIFVTDLGRSRSFYAQFGFEEIAYGESGEGDAKWCVSLVDKDGFTIELVLPPASEHAAVNARKDGVIDHIALDVLDADAAYVELKAAGMEMIDPAPVPLPLFENGVKYFMIRGPQGERVEFNELVR